MEPFDAMRCALLVIKNKTNVCVCRSGGNDWMRQVTKKIYLLFAYRRAAGQETVRDRGSDQVQLCIRRIARTP